MAEHCLSTDLIWKTVYDAPTQSLKITSSGKDEFAIELRAEDGDSVISKNESTTLTEGTHSCVGMKTACLYGEGVVEVSPNDDGDSWHQLELPAISPKSICARRIKLTGPGQLVIQSN